MNTIPDYPFSRHDVGVKAEIFIDQKHQIDLSTNQIDERHFPYKTWTRLSKIVLSEDRVMNDLIDPQGHMQLRVEISKYLVKYRGIIASPNQIIIGSGSQAMAQLLIALLGRHLFYGMEDPGFLKLRHLFELSGANLFPIPLDDKGISMHGIHTSRVDVIHVTPSHQFPTGIIMPISRRIELLNWATQKGKWIIEDDYDSEFRYIGQPIPALKSLDKQGRVIYMNTFSKSLSPAIKTNYLVLPDDLMSTYNAIKHAIACSVPLFDQFVLMRFMKEGHFDRHLNRMKKVYRQKIDRCIQAFSDLPEIGIEGSESGLHMIIKMKSLHAIHDFQTEMQKQKIYMPTIQDYAVRELEKKAIFIFGYAHLEDSRLIDAINAIK